MLMHLALGLPGTNPLPHVWLTWRPAWLRTWLLALLLLLKPEVVRHFLEGQKKALEVGRLALQERMGGLHQVPAVTQHTIDVYRALHCLLFYEKNEPSTQKDT